MKGFLYRCAKRNQIGCWISYDRGRKLTMNGNRFVVDGWAVGMGRDIIIRKRYERNGACSQFVANTISLSFLQMEFICFMCCTCTCVFVCVLSKHREWKDEHRIKKNDANEKEENLPKKKTHKKTKIIGNEGSTTAKAKSYTENKEVDNSHKKKKNKKQLPKFISQDFIVAIFDGDILVENKGSSFCRCSMDSILLCLVLLIFFYFMYSAHKYIVYIQCLDFMFQQRRWILLCG